MGGKQPVAVVVVSWNSAATIEACVEAALAEAPAECVVVDNGSTDDTLERLRAFAAVESLPLGRNTGFAAGCNHGVEQTESPYLLFLNDDALLQPGYLEVLVDALQRDSAAASATGKLVFEEDGRLRIDSAGIALRRRALSPLDRGYGESDVGQYEASEEIFGPSAAAALYRRRALEEVGGFDAGLFAYYEDVDLAWRLNNQGWRHLYRPQAVAFHRRRGPEAKPSAIAARAFANRYVVFAKNESLLRFASYAPIAGAWEAARLMRRAMQQPGLLVGLPAAWGEVLRVLGKRVTGL